MGEPDHTRLRKHRMPLDRRRPPGDLFVPHAESRAVVVEPEPAPEPERAARRRLPVRPPVAMLAVAALGVFVVWRVALAASRLPAAVGETRLVDGSAAVLGGRGGIGSGFGELVAGLQLTGYAALTRAFDRYPDLLGGARELALVAAVVLLVAVVVVARRWGIGPLALAAVLVALAACTPAVAALATFGPGLLGAAWLAVGAALTGPGRSPRRLVGALAGAVGIASAPLLAVPVAVAVVVLTARRWAPTAEVAAALGSAALVLAILSPLSATSTVVGGDRIVLVVAGAVVVVGGLLLPGLRAAAATAGSVVLLAAVPWAGADTAVPALVVATVVLGAALVHEVAARVAARPPAVRRAAGVVAALGAVALAVVAVLVVVPEVRPAPAPAPAPAQAVPHAALAAWITGTTAPGDTVTVPPELVRPLLADGVPADRLGPGGSLLVRPAGPRTAAVLARFGDGPTALGVEAVDATAVDAVAAEAPARAAAGRQLASNPSLVAPDGVREVLRAGGVDSRALVLLVGLTAFGPVTVVDLPVVPGEDVALPRHRVLLADVAGPTGTWLRAQRPPFAPIVGGPFTTTLTWPLPAVPGLLG
jgi:hypothetical protein